MLDEKSSNTASVVVLCTAPDEATAQDLAAKVLAEKLAACATLIPGATSLYYWEGKLEQEYEVQMILKTTVSHQQALSALRRNTRKLPTCSCRKASGMKMSFTAKARFTAIG
ncbi:CutA1 domain containing protein [Trichuris trichiura]|uniref:CutA1 domain containing protein n=1 Tax=Trichuris trichiura TaxID=36087 RepID=A0A077ZE71_TRITR|nr:CutA1 domain containing protein [Trichuris trichiura]